MTVNNDINNKDSVSTEQPIETKEWAASSRRSVISGISIIAMTMTASYWGYGASALKSGVSTLGYGAGALSGYFYSKTETEKVCDAITQLSSTDYENLLHFIKTGDLLVLNSSLTNILQGLGNNWLELQGQTSPSSRISDILSIAENSPVVLFQCLTRYSQPFVWKYLQQNLISWSSDDTDQAIANNKIVNGTTPQFAKDFPRTHYRVQQKNNTADFPISYKGDKMGAFIAALQKFSVFNGMETIPLQVQDALTQATALTYVLVPLWNSLNSLLPPPNTSCRILTLEEGDETSCLLTIDEHLSFQEESLAISFQYSYQFKLSKIGEDEWSMELVSLSPWKSQLGKDFNCLLSTSAFENPDLFVTDTLFNTLADQIENNIAAFKQCQDLATKKRLSAVIQKQLEVLQAQFPEETLKQNRERLEAIFNNIHGVVYDIYI